MIAFWIVSLIVVPCDDPVTVEAPQSAATVVSQETVTEIKRVVESKTAQSSGLWLGVSCAEIPPALQPLLNVKCGVLVQCVAKDSPASQVEIQPSDLLVSLDGQPIPSVEGLVELVQETAGKRVNLELRRNGVPTTIEIQAQPRPRRKVAMVMVGPDGKPLGKDSAKILESIGETSDGTVYSIVVVRPGIVLPKEKISSSLHPKMAFSTKTSAEFAPAVQHQDLIALESIKNNGRLGFPSTLNLATDNVRSIQNGTIELEEERIELFPAVGAGVFRIERQTTDQYVLKPHIDSPQIRIVSLRQTDAKGNEQSNQFQVEFSTESVSDVDRLRHKANEMELKLEEMHAQLEALHKQIAELDVKRD